MAAPPSFFFAHFPKILIRNHLLSPYTSRSPQNIEPQALIAKIFQDKELAEYSPSNYQYFLYKDSQILIPGTLRIKFAAVPRKILSKNDLHVKSSGIRS